MQETLVGLSGGGRVDTYVHYLSLSPFCSNAPRSAGHFPHTVVSDSASLLPRRKRQCSSGPLVLEEIRERQTIAEDVLDSTAFVSLSLFSHLPPPLLACASGSLWPGPGTYLSDRRANQAGRAPDPRRGSPTPSPTPSRHPAIRHKTGWPSSNQNRPLPFVLLSLSPCWAWSRY
jgi:hypothetical protein